MKTNQAIKIVDLLREATSKGCSFISFLYTTKGTQETSIYTINFGIDYRASVEHDKLALESYQPKNDLEVQGKAEMLKSLTETLNEGVSQSYTNVDTYENLGKGIKIHKETDELYIFGYVQSKTVIAEAQNPKKPVNSKPLTLAKKGIEKACEFKRTKFTQYILNPENIAGLKVKGNLIELQ